MATYSSTQTGGLSADHDPFFTTPAERQKAHELLQEMRRRWGLNSADRREHLTLDEAGDLLGYRFSCDDPTI